MIGVFNLNPEKRVIASYTIEVGEGKYKVTVKAKLVSGREEERKIYFGVNGELKEIGVVNKEGVGEIEIELTAPYGSTYKTFRVGVGIREPYIPENVYHVEVYLDENKIGEATLDTRMILEIPIKVVKVPKEVKKPEKREETVSEERKITIEGILVPLLISITGGVVGYFLSNYIKEVMKL